MKHRLTNGPVPGSTPACFDDDKQWDDWQYYSASSCINSDNYCTDCLPEFHDRMCKEGRCAWPKTIFVKFGSTVIGRRRGPKVKGLP